MRLERLTGWNVGVEKIEILEPGENGEPKKVDGWRLRFQEAAPPTGDEIIYEFGKPVRDYLVRELTSGIVLHGGEFPQL